MTEIEVRYGALVPPLREQLRGILAVRYCKQFDRAMESVLFLHLHDIITDSDRDKAMARLHRRLMRTVANYGRSAEYRDAARSRA